MSQSFVVGQLKAFFKRTEADILNYKNIASALSSQKFENVLLHLLFVHIYIKYIFFYMYAYTHILCIFHCCAICLLCTFSVSFC